MAISLRSVGASPGANSANCIITKPANLALGDFMLAHVVNKATSGTITPPANWTIIGAQSNTASSRSALFWKFAVQADVDATTFTFTLGTTGRNRGEMGAWLGVDTTAPINAADQQINAAGTSIAVPTPTVMDGCLVLIVGSNALGGIATACSGSDPTATITLGYAVAYSTYCALAMFSGVKSGTDAIDAHSLSTFTSAVSSGHAVALTPAAAPEQHSGSTAISGKGSLVGVGQKGGKGSALASGKGTLVAVGQKNGRGSVLNSCKGAVVALGMAGMMGLVVISAGGSISSLGMKNAYRSSIISGRGSITAEGGKLETHSGSAAISGNGLISSLGAKRGGGSGVVSGGGILATGGIKNGKGSSLVAGAGSVAAAGVKVGASIAEVSTGGSIISEGKRSASGSTVISSNGAFITTGKKNATGSSTISAAGLIIAIGFSSEGEEYLYLGSSVISGGGTVLSTNVKTALGSSIIPGNGGLSAFGAKTAFSLASISGNGFLAAAGGMVIETHQVLAFLVDRGRTIKPVVLTHRGEAKEVTKRRPPDRWLKGSGIPE